MKASADEASLDDRQRDLLGAIRARDETRALALLKLVDLNSIRDESGRTPLHLAVEDASMTFVVDQLLSHGAAVNATNANGTTPLHRAARAGHEPIVRALLSHGADANALNGRGNSAAHLARSESIRHVLQAEGGAQLARADAVAAANAGGANTADGPRCTPAEASGLSHAWQRQRQHSARARTGEGVRRQSSWDDYARWCAAHLDAPKSGSAGGGAPTDGIASVLISRERSRRAEAASSRLATRSASMRSAAERLAAARRAEEGHGTARGAAGVVSGGAGGDSGGASTLALRGGLPGWISAQVPRGGAPDQANSSANSSANTRPGAPAVVLTAARADRDAGGAASDPVGSILSDLANSVPRLVMRAGEGVVAATSAATSAVSSAAAIGAALTRRGSSATPLQLLERDLADLEHPLGRAVGDFVGDFGEFTAEAEDDAEAALAEAARRLCGFESTILESLFATDRGASIEEAHGTLPMLDAIEAAYLPRQAPPRLPPPLQPSARTLRCACQLAAHVPATCTRSGVCHPSSASTRARAAAHRPRLARRARRCDSATRA